MWIMIGLFKLFGVFFMVYQHVITQLSPGLVWCSYFPWPMFSICTHFRHVSSQRGVETWKLWCLWVIDPVTCSSGLRPWPRHRCSAFATHKCKSWWLLCISSIRTLCRNEYIYIYVFVFIYRNMYICMSFWLWGFAYGDVHVCCVCCVSSDIG